MEIKSSQGEIERAINIVFIVWAISIVLRGFNLVQLLNREVHLYDSGFSRLAWMVIYIPRFIFYALTMIAYLTLVYNIYKGKRKLMAFFVVQVIFNVVRIPDRLSFHSFNIYTVYEIIYMIFTIAILLYLQYGRTSKAFYGEIGYVNVIKRH